MITMFGAFANEDGYVTLSSGAATWHLHLRVAPRQLNLWAFLSFLQLSVFSPVFLVRWFQPILILFAKLRTLEVKNIFIGMTYVDKKL